MCILFSIVIKQGETVLVSSGDIYDTTISGGRAGLFVHAQPGAIFSNLKYECLDRVNKGMQFDGVDDYLNVTDILTLESEHRWFIVFFCFFFYIFVIFVLIFLQAKEKNNIGCLNGKEIINMLTSRSTEVIIEIRFYPFQFNCGYEKWLW